MNGNVYEIRIFRKCILVTSFRVLGHIRAMKLQQLWSQDSTLEVYVTNLSTLVYKKGA